MVRMKALRTFQGSSEGDLMRRGREFDAVDERRADELEAHGLAHRIHAKVVAPVPVPKELKNSAADTGPFVSVGGTTGEAEPAPSSLQDPPRRQRRLNRSEGGSQY